MVIISLHQRLFSNPITYTGTNTNSFTDCAFFAADVSSFYTAVFIAFSTSKAVGRDGIAPNLVTDMPAATEA